MARRSVRPVPLAALLRTLLEALESEEREAQESEAEIRDEHGSLCLRPEDVAAELRVSERKLWEIAQEDKDWPRWIKLSPRVTVMRRCDLQTYLEKKARDAAEGRPQ